MLKTDEDWDEYFEYVKERQTKTRTGIDTSITPGNVNLRLGTISKIYNAAQHITSIGTTANYQCLTVKIHSFLLLTCQES